MKKIKLLEECVEAEWDGHIVDTGPHIFHTSNKELWKFWKKKFWRIAYQRKIFF